MTISNFGLVEVDVPRIKAKTLSELHFIESKRLNEDNEFVRKWLRVYKRKGWFFGFSLYRFLNFHPKYWFTPIKNADADFAIETLYDHNERDHKHGDYWRSEYSFYRKKKLEQIIMLCKEAEATHSGMHGNQMKLVPTIWLNEYHIEALNNRE